MNLPEHGRSPHPMTAQEIIAALANVRESRCGKTHCCREAVAAQHWHGLVTALVVVFVMAVIWKGCT